MIMIPRVPIWLGRPRQKFLVPFRTVRAQKTGHQNYTAAIVSCIAGDAEEGLTPELDGKADILVVEGTLLGIGFTGSDSDIAAIGDVDVKRSA
ncbi:hypothetical protein TNCV_173261 [Trichonephila clavipes]|nr:hypothetical protein TNCV_173261 [Trichonephila clavipes]